MDLFWGSLPWGFLPGGIYNTDNKREWVQIKYKKNTNRKQIQIPGEWRNGVQFSDSSPDLPLLPGSGLSPLHRLNINHNQPLSSSSSLQNYHHCYKQVWRAQATLRETACVDCKLHHHATRSVFKTLNFENLKKKKVKLIVNCKLQIAPSCHQVSLQILTFWNFKKPGESSKL